MSTAPVFEAEHPLLAALTAARAELSAAGECASWSLSDAQVVAVLGELFALRAQVEALTATQVRQADARGLAVSLNQSSTPRWLRRRFLITRREADRLHTLATALPAWPTTHAALGAGTVGVEAASAITRALTELPPTTTPAEVEQAQALLLEQATTLEPEELTRCGHALAEALTTTPDTDNPVEAALLAAQAEHHATRQDAQQCLRLRPRADGMTRLDGLLAPLTAAAVRAALTPRAGRTPTDDGIRDPRTRDQRMAAALHELALQALGTGNTPPTGTGTSTGTDTATRTGAQPPPPSAQPALAFGAGHGEDDTDAEKDDDGEYDGDLEDDASGEDASVGPSPGAAGAAGADPPPTRSGASLAPASVTLLIRWEALQALRPRAGILDDNTPLAPSQLLTALCDAAVLPAVFTGAARPLHLGRRRRTFTPTQRAALAARDRGCSFPGCTRPPAATNAHHMTHWAHGGTTDIDNGALLCPYHHTLVHREGWQARLAPNGHVHYTPPHAFDPTRRPRQHLRYRGTTK